MTPTLLAESMLEQMSKKSFDDDAFIDRILREHRTCQQNVFRTLQGLIAAWAESPSDLRNEYTVKTCKKFVNADDIGVKAPYI